MSIETRTTQAPHQSRPEDHMSEPTSPDATPRELLTPAQLADRWGVSTGHLANLRHHGEGIGYLKIGSRVAYRLRDVIDYENQHYVAVP